MKKFVKVCLAICGGSLMLGIVMLGIGTAMGARPGQYLNIVHLDRWHNLRNTRLTSLEDLDDFLDDVDDLDEVLDPDEWLDDYDHHGGEYDHDWKYGEIGEAPGGSYEYDQTITEQIEELDIAISHGRIWIIPHQENTVRVLAQDTLDYFQCWVEDKELHLEDKRRNKMRDITLVVYLPEKEYEEIKVQMGAGYMEASTLKAAEVTLQMGAGECHVQQIEAREKAELEAGAGRIWLGAFSGTKLQGECGAGELDISLAGAYEDYSYEIGSAIGEVLLGDHSYAGIGRTEEVNHHTDRKVELDCAVGTIRVSFLGGTP